MLARRIARDHRGAATGRMRILPVSKALPCRVIVDRASGDGESKIVGLIIDVLSSLTRCRPSRLEPVRRSGSGPDRHTGDLGLVAASLTSIGHRSAEAIALVVAITADRGGKSFSAFGAHFQHQRPRRSSSGDGKTMLSPSGATDAPNRRSSAWTTSS